MTDVAGAYRFPAVPPGRYEVTATLAGFGPVRRSNIALELGQILRVDLTLGPAGVYETVDVSAESPLIDVKQNAAGATSSRRSSSASHRGRDFTWVVTSAPGITDETRNRGIQIDGASGADNRFMIDGVDTTNLPNGTSGKGVAPEFVEEVQVKASGYNADTARRSAASSARSPRAAATSSMAAPGSTTETAICLATSGRRSG